MGLWLEFLPMLFFSFQFVCEKSLDIYKCFEWKTNTRACKQILLGLSVRDYDWIFHKGNISLSIYCEKGDTFLFFVKNKVFMTYKRLPLGPNTQGHDWTFHLGSLFLSLLFEMVKVCFSHFKFDYENLMLGQVFICVCGWIELWKWFVVGVIVNEMMSFGKLVWFGKLV